jgi:hypothetical protein
MLVGLAGLITAIALLIAVCGGIYIAYRPPKLLKKIKFKDFESEFEPTTPPGTPALSAAQGEPSTAEAAISSQDPQVAKELPASDDSQVFSEIWRLLSEGKYKEGLDLAREETAKEENRRTAIAHDAFYLYLAFTKGSSEAFTELGLRASSQTNHSGVQDWWARSLEFAGRLDDAVDAGRGALATAADEAERVTAVVLLQALLCRLNRNSEARALLRNELTRTSSPARLSSLYVSLGKTYELDKPADIEKSFLMRELAVRSDPSAKRLRFDLAFAYAEKGANEISLAHYRRVIADDPNHSDARNNAGVAMERLALPLTGVSYYKAAQAAGETLASANLAYRLIAAGFKEEAEAILEDARNADEVHRNVHLAVGRLAEAEAEEETKLKQIMERAGKFRAWRVEYAEALLRDSPPREAVAGSYAGVPSVLELAIDIDGSAKGGFRFAPGKTATLQGRLDGAAVTFEWSEILDPKDSIAAILGRKKGHGVLLVQKDRLDGFFAEGSAEVDSRNADEWKAWHLTKDAKQPLLLSEST